MANSFMQYRTAEAAAKDILIAAAAKAWGVNAEELTLRDRVISGARRDAGIGDFLVAAAAMEVPAEPTLIDRSEFRIISREIKARRDTADKINGQSIYSMDVQ